MESPELNDIPVARTSISDKIAKAAFVLHEKTRPDAQIDRDLEKVTQNYTTNQKANRSIIWAILALVILIVGILFPSAHVGIIIVIITCWVSLYYAKKASADGSADLKRVKAARIISKTVSILCGIIFILNILVGILMVSK